MNLSDPLGNLSGCKPRVNPLTLVLFLSALLLVVHYGIEFAHAQAAPAPAPAGAGWFAKTNTLGALLQGISEFISGALLVGIGIANKLLPEARSLLIAISGLMLAWYAVTWILGGDLEDIIKAFIMFVLLWGLAKYALDNYATFVGAINDGFTQIMQIMGVDVNNYIASLMNLASKTFGGINDALDKMDVGFSFSKMAVMLIGYLMALVLSVIIFIVGAVVAAFIAVSQVMMAIAVALGPVLIPFLMLPPLSGLAMGWLNFMIYAGFVKLVGAVMVIFLSDMIGGLANASFVQVTDGDPVFMWGNFLAAIIIVILSAVMSLFIMEIASGMVGGSPLRGILQTGQKTAGNTAGSVKSGARGIIDKFKKTPTK